MKRLKTASLLVIFSTCLVGLSLALPYTVTTDISSVPLGTAFDLEFSLIGWGDVYDAYVYIDNIFVSDPAGNIIVDFETGTMEGFSEDPWNAAGTVSIVSGHLPYRGGNYMLKLMEDPTGMQLTTIVYRGFTPSVPGILRFEFEIHNFEIGVWGEDTFVVSLYDTFGNPLLPSGVYGPGDPAILEATLSSGVKNSPDTTSAPIPEPATILLWSSGLLSLLIAAGGYRRIRIKR